MNRIGFRVTQSKPPASLHHSFTLKDIENCTLNLARKEGSHLATFEHLFVALYMRNPQMIREILEGKIELQDLSERLLGFKVNKDNSESFFRQPMKNDTLVLLSPDVQSVFRLAKNVAKLVKHQQAGCAELFISLLMVSNKNLKIKALIDELGIDIKNHIQRQFLETNIPKHQTPPQLLDPDLPYTVPVSFN